ncbi:UbiX family flavin prenyltransferase [Microbulbifer thermotolerans]|uniref:Flavin prenyltransferase UbiX n=2 Tax=Microbulbifer thermotolerans TaxID=252514 RepID=A0AB35HZI3_MICTH|nr:flavin prenyltransferase UbiX [Microbulbifer thermotolerans]MCX2781698.1 UbiX family flavin prenyltransferase [Microbulbifer thermotolerans]MCX2793570.1 UbiX family flavin prenyltransferase [Microbulbifer thermotolerans]MCX2801560.1 UbiX family flavin prenyltransferase [Microbulbifer thermotolerans]MCX2835396.1 UbiX family flavin prenyltransferase [Microbulbifer thermotolerans]
MGQPAFSKTVTLAMTGASGAQYGLRLLQCLLAARVRVWLLLSDAARVVINTETELHLPEDESEQEAFFAARFGAREGQLKLFGKRDWFSPVASGSGAPASMVICPASGGTLSAIACGASNNLIERAADVALKERRQLLLVPRETPYSEIHLENMLKLTRMGAVILPASPGFYQQPRSVEDLVDFIVARLLDHLGVEQNLLPEWGG